MADICIIATRALSTLAVITTPSPTPSSMPVTNLLHYQPGKVAEFLDLMQSEVTFNLTASLANSAYHGLTSYRYVFIIGANATSAATVEVFTGPDESSVSSAISATVHVGPQLYWITPDVLGVRFPMVHTFVDLGSQRSEPYLRVVISDVTNPAGVLDVGVMFPHPGYSPSLGITTRPEISADEQQSSVLTVSGAEHTRVAPISRIRSVTLQATGAGARDEVLEEWAGLQEVIGLHDGFALVTNVAPTSNYMDEFVYGRLTSFEKVLLPESYGLSQLILNYRELR